MLLLLLNSQTIEPVEILGGYGGPKRNYRRQGRLIEADIDKALAELEKARKLAAKAIGEQAPAVIKAKDVDIDWAGYLRLDAVNSVMTNLITAVNSSIDYSEGLSVAKVAKQKRIVQQMEAIETKINQLHKEVRRRDDDELAILMLLN
ncbi:hypothetical protein UFOVP826_61 [uncultured Caudovirales phage]|uniref:Uncharacterized protein n=1 Tax=uncultured Caudovirales phage TaxID=2100421 RepID=A0A6J5P025_9CAUD|nr:hypothetical protein UFOVP826_61 [uncultured Caudovirales phage]